MAQPSAGRLHAWPVWRVCVTAGVLGRGRGVSKDFSSSVAVPCAPWPGCTELVFVAKGGPVIVSRAGSWGDELWVCVLSCCSFFGLWQRKWGGRFRKFGSLPGTMLRERGQSRQELLENIEVVFWVCVFTVQVEITTCRNNVCFHVRNGTLTESRICHWKEGEVEGLWRARAQSLLLLWGSSWRRYLSWTLRHSLHYMCVHFLRGCYSLLERKWFVKLTQVLHCRAHPETQGS